MRCRVRTLLRLIGAGIALVLIAGLVAPYLTADQYGQRLQASLARALGRRVELGKVRFSLFKGPGFSVDSVTIYEDPAIGIEPIAYVQEPGSLEVVPRLWSLLGGRFVIASIRLEDASINLTKSGGGNPASGDPGRWNFASLVNPSVMRTTPAIHVRNGRFNFKFGDTKSVFYLMRTDLDISPPGTAGRGWSVYCSAKPARTDRPAQGLGSFTLQGRWYVAPERVDLSLEVDRAGLGEITALLRGQSGGIHGSLSSRLHLAGPLNRVGIQGRLDLHDVHRWDLPPRQGQGWPLDVRGSLDLLAQRLELQSTPASGATPPLWIRFRASDYLAQPHWAVAVNWNRFPAGPLMQLGEDMGAQFPRGLKLSGSMDGAIGYSGAGSFQGQLGFHDAAVAIPNSPSIQFEHAYLIVDHGHVHLSPAVVRTADDQARIEADYALDQQVFDLTISCDAMKVASLRSQVALAAVPWLEQVRSGQWSGQLHYHREPGEGQASKAGWGGRLELTGAEVGIEGLASPLLLHSARAQIDGAKVALDRLRGEAGKIAFTGDYRYDPAALHPHRVRIRIAEADAADLEAELAPTLRRSGGLIARALGRAAVPAWLKQRQVEGVLQVDDLLLGGSHLENLRALLLWDVTRLDLDGLQGRVDGAAITGKLSIGLRGARPVYTLTGAVKGLTSQAGKLDAEGVLGTSGTGRELLANLRLEDLTLRTEDETYTGTGAVQEDGRLLVVLTNGAKEMRMTGTLAKLTVE